MSEQLEKQEENKPLRDERGRLLPGGTANPHGRPKGKTMKEFVAEKFRNMTEEEKAEWLAQHKIQGIDQWRMAEGNPHQSSTVDAEINPKPLLNVLRSHNGSQEDSPPQ